VGVKHSWSRGSGCWKLPSRGPSVGGPRASPELLRIVGRGAQCELRSPVEVRHRCTEGVDGHLITAVVTDHSPDRDDSFGRDPSVGVVKMVLMRLPLGSGGVHHRSARGLMAAHLHRFRLFQDGRIYCCGFDARRTVRVR